MYSMRSPRSIALLASMLGYKSNNLPHNLSRIRMGIDRAAPRPKTEQDLQRLSAAEAKRQRRAQKLAHARVMGGIQGNHADQVIVDKLA